MNTQAAVTIGSLIVAIVSLYFLYRKNEREDRAQENDDAETTVSLLREQNELLRHRIEQYERDGNEREAEWREREKSWKAERVETLARIETVERDYRNLVLTVTTMGFCASASECKDYNPGDRRTKAGVSTDA
jgi:response regulator RpfG family c-di-GMP phosphodiesterase